MTLVFRSLVGGVLASLPMLLAVVLIFGVLGNFGIPLNMTTSLLTCILVGVGIDYSVHFLWHLREHLREGDNLDDASSAKSFLNLEKSLLANSDITLFISKSFRAA